MSDDFRFGNGKMCCGKPVGCTMTHRGCAYRNHPFKHPEEPNAPCCATGVRDDPETGERIALTCDLTGPHTEHSTVGTRTGRYAHGFPGHAGPCPICPFAQLSVTAAAPPSVTGTE